MKLLHAQYEDLIGRALDCAVVSARNGTEDHPLTPERFWDELKQDGFYFPRDPPGSDEHGRFFAHLVLDHAVALGKIRGNTALHHYWSNP